ncbi:response regulator [Aliarcobacter cryaerophilus]|uniref:response regulator transcription factor n=1 Tax=Aliarcobacter cryaerophilus TaxID=28198 RepID=UPI0021B69C6D|nr:response regulator [Aliarcobacter cryaerophilus]MCT7466831.1 response regulator [Aliarcobacter cryaerophilus]
MENESTKIKEKDLRNLIEITKNLKVLYVEDNENVRLQTTKVLSIYFENITQTKNGTEALKKIKNCKFDLIFTDINMPEINGIEMIKQIREKDDFVPIIVISAYDNTEYFLKTIEYGIDGYILKPFKFDTIQNIIKKTISKLHKLTKDSHIIKLIDNYHWNTEELCLYKKNEAVKLTKKETILFKLLSSSINATYTSEEIEIELFNDSYCDNKRVRSLISRLKNKLSSNLITSIYAQGYKLNKEIQC